VFIGLSNDFKSLVGTQLSYGEYYEKIMEFKKRTDVLALNFANRGAQMEGLAFEHERYIKDFQARSCGRRFLIL
jgi:hypothetical protein